MSDLDALRRGLTANTATVADEDTGVLFVSLGDYEQCRDAGLAALERLKVAEHLLSRLRKWDMLDATADGAYWASEIDGAIG